MNKMKVRKRICLEIQNRKAIFPLYKVSEKPELNLSPQLN